MEKVARLADDDNPAVRRALAIVLMREVLPLLDALAEDVAANHLQLAIDTVLQGAAATRPTRSG